MTFVALHVALRILAAFLIAVLSCAVGTAVVALSPLVKEGLSARLLKGNIGGALAWPLSLLYLVFRCAARTDAVISYAAFSEAFCKNHVVIPNIAVHLIGTSLMLWGWLSCLSAALCPLASRVAAVAYVVLLARFLGKWEWLGSALTVAAMAGLASLLPLGLWGVLLPGLNEVVTFVTHDWYEPTFISTYSDEPLRSFLEHLALHLFFLLPLGQTAAARASAKSRAAQHA